MSDAIRQAAVGAAWGHLGEWEAEMAQDIRDDIRSRSRAIPTDAAPAKEQ